MSKLSPEGGDQIVLLRGGALRRWAAGSLMSCGVPEADAALAAGFLVRASLRGSASHGIVRLPSYVDKLMSGDVQAAPKVDLVARGSLIQYDGGNGLGQVTLPRAVQIASNQAQETPVVC